MVRLAHRENYRHELVGSEHVIAILVELREGLHAFHCEGLGEEFVPDPMRQVGDDVLDGVSILAKLLQQVFNLHCVLHDVFGFLHGGASLVGVNVAHEEEEPSEVQELILPEHAITVEVKDANEALALILRHRPRMGSTEFHDYGIEFMGPQDIGQVLVELLEASVAVLHEGLAVEKLVVDVLRHHGDDGVDCLSILLHGQQQLLDKVLALDDIHIILQQHTLVSVHVGHDHHETCKVEELGSRDHAVALRVEDVQKVPTVLLGERVLVCVAEVLHQGQELRSLENSALVHVQRLEVSHALLSELWAHQFLLEARWQVWDRVPDRFGVVLEVLKELLDLLLAEEDLCCLHFLVTPHVEKVGHHDREASQLLEAPLGGEPSAIQIKEGLVLLEVIVADREVELQLVAESGDDREQSRDTEDSLALLVCLVEALIAGLSEGAASDEIHQHLGQRVHHLRQAVRILLQCLDELQGFLRLGGQLGLPLHFVSVRGGAQEIENRKELRELEELILQNGAVLVHVEHADKLLALLVINDERMCLAEAFNHGQELQRIELLVVVRVQGLKVGDALGLERDACDVIYEPLGQEGDD
mmetsp:Transcript_13607/g.29986  ORF Transcript_13607/g.29986 Transcript_13607/m.29986 type:complete len:588 (+) Transcript_13607:690-2453(+)